ncbi:Ty3/gypsy retrotransposon protein [Quillaja saponaria]|uniref:Ty3/gypsy retrotransposon protein n=1 Tax=Quillaja saponaria TaxID=32244 RepID=A0AAD7KNC9_QUISA|nr:Ty3/gypsy retrotransposon protein [Quillaja saponaria]
MKQAAAKEVVQVLFWVVLRTYRRYLWTSIVLIKRFKWGILSISSSSLISKQLWQAGANKKLNFKIFGPYLIIRKVGDIAYELLRRPAAKIYLVFHVSQLRVAIGDKMAQTVLPDCDEKGLIRLKPMAILERRTIKQGNRPVTQVLVKWPKTCRTLQQKFPSFHP